MSDELGDYDLADYEDDVSLDPEDKKEAKPTNQIEWFKGEKGVTYRAALVYFHPLDIAAVKAALKEKPELDREGRVKVAQAALAKRAEELGKAVDQLAEHEKLHLNGVRFKKILAHYKEGVGYAISRLGQDGPEADEAWKMMGDQKKYFTTVLLVYPTNRQGDIDRDRLANGWYVKPWRFANKVYSRLHQVAESLRSNSLSISNQDLSLKCTNAEYQNFDIDGYGAALWRKNPKFQGMVLEKAVALYDKLVPFREISSADLRLKLGLTSGGGDGSGVSDVSDDEFGDLLGGV